MPKSPPKAPGTVTVGEDTKGRHYRYEAGGGRGRKPVSLNPDQLKALRGMGLVPGGKVNLAPGVASNLGLGANATPAGARPGNIPKAPGAAPKPQPRPPRKAPVVKMSKGQIGDVKDKVIASHRRWHDPMRSTSQARDRVSKILSRGREEWLRDGRNNKTDAHKAVAASVLGAVFGKDINVQAMKDTGVKIGLHLGARGEKDGIWIQKDGGPKHNVEFKNVKNLSTGAIAALRNKLKEATGDTKMVDREVKNLGKHDQEPKQPKAPKQTKPPEATKPPEEPKQPEAPKQPDKPKQAERVDPATLSEHHAKLVSQFDKAVDGAAHIPAENKTLYKEAAREAFSKINATAAERMTKSVKKYEFYKNTDEMTTDLIKRYDDLKGKGYEQRTIGGCFNHGDGTMFLDGHDLPRKGVAGKFDTLGMTAASIYAHEFAHAYEWSEFPPEGTPGWQQYRNTKSPEWMYTYLTEFGKDGRTTYKLNSYAATKPSEAWAEFGRLTFCGMPKSELQKKFPRATAIWEQHGILNVPETGTEEEVKAAWDKFDTYGYGTGDIFGPKPIPTDKKNPDMGHADPLNIKPDAAKPGSATEDVKPQEKKTYDLDNPTNEGMSKPEAKKKAAATRRKNTKAGKNVAKNIGQAIDDVDKTRQKRARKPRGN